jgi:glycosyltransferase involved in cell wall biosynthesis
VKRQKRKVLLVFHTAYTFQLIKDLGLEIFVTSRNSAEVFDLVITVNPLADLQTYKSQEIPRHSPRKYLLDDKNIIIEGYSGRFLVLDKFPKINFLVAQLSLVSYLVRKGYLRDVKLARGEDPRFNGVYAFIFSRILHVPLIIGLWGNPGRLRKLNESPVMPRMFKSMRQEENLEKFVLKHADLVLAQNKENISYALETNVPLERTAITPLGIGIDKFHFVAPDLRPSFSKELKGLGVTEKLIFVCISRLESIKMVDHAIKACALVAKSGLKFNLIIVGEGREKDKLQDLAVELGLKDVVIFAGNKSQAWIASLMPNVYLNLAPLCGRSLLEASLSGCPAVAYDVDWHSDIVINNQTGFLVENLNYFELAKSIEQFVNAGEARRSEMKRNMYALALDQASPEKLVEAQRRIYGKFL